MGEACLEGLSHETYLPTLRLAQSQGEHFPWYTLKVRTGGELAAVSALKYRGFSPYCPTQIERRRYSDRMKAVEVAVFPGYIFCQFDAQRKLPVVSSPGVEYIVGSSAVGLVPVPDAELDNVRRMIEAGGTAVRTLERGERVRVTHGPLAGVEGMLVRDSDGDRLVASIEALGQGAFLHIDVARVCPINSRSESLPERQRTV